MSMQSDVVAPSTEISDARRNWTALRTVARR